MFNAMELKTNLWCSKYTLADRRRDYEYKNFKVPCVIKDYERH